MRPPSIARFASCGAPTPFVALWFSGVSGVVPATADLSFPCDQFLSFSAGVRVRPFEGLMSRRVLFGQRRRGRTVLLLDDRFCSFGGCLLPSLRLGGCAQQDPRDDGTSQLHGEFQGWSERTRAAVLSARAWEFLEVRVDGLLDVHDQDAEAERADDLCEEHDEVFQKLGRWRTARPPLNRLRPRQRKCSPADLQKRGLASADRQLSGQGEASIRRLAGDRRPYRSCGSLDMMADLNRASEQGMLEPG